MGKEGAARGPELQRGRGLLGPALWLIAACAAPQQSQPPAPPAPPAPVTAVPEPEPEPEPPEPEPEPQPLEAPDDVAAPPLDAKTLGKGLRYKVLAHGTGTVHPSVNDSVTVHYSGWTTDGQLFDSSVQRGRPATFRPNQVIEGWTMALTHMRAGDRWRVWIPETLAYKGRAGAPAGMLVFDIEVISVQVTPPPPQTPADVKQPPSHARKTASGVSYRFLGDRKPNGQKPTADSTVVVHYSGWTTDGKLFDSSITRGKPARFPLSAVIPGWRDGILEMRAGEKLRMWIPEELAYQGRAGTPQGMLVFDVELLEVSGPE